MKQFIFIFYSYLLKYIYPISILGKSTLESCTQESTDDLSCSSKIVLSLTIQNAELENNDFISFTLSNITDSSGQNRVLSNPYKITISKSSVLVNYPCIYLQDFNYHPVEKIIASDIFTCEDGDLSSNPTCGWQKDSDGNKIENSQGFCCKCDFNQIIGIDGSTSIRGNKCKVLNLGINSSTAHCLSFNELWFSAYEINQYSLSYTIKVNIISTQNTSDIQTLTLTPSNTISTSNDKNILVKIIGDFLPPNSLPPDYSSYYLLTPSYPETHIMVMEGSNYWMMVKNNMFTLDGRECDKIGVSYYAFQTQGGLSRCEISSGSCLNNQIYDLLESDLEGLSKNESPKYLLSQDKTKKWKFYSYNKENKKLSYTLSGNINTLITIELNADNIQYVVNVSTGVIDSLVISNFEAMTKNGLMQIQITNTGKLTATFYISYSCSETILPLSSDEISISPLQSTMINKNVYTSSSYFNMNECNVTLKNSKGEINDEKTIQFNTTEQINNNNQDPTHNNSNKNNTNEKDNSSSSKSDLTCSDYCPGFWSFGCFVVHGCWWYFTRTCLVILLIGGAILFIIKGIINGLFCRCMDKISGKKKKNNKKVLEKMTVQNCENIAPVEGSTRFEINRSQDINSNSFACPSRCLDEDFNKCSCAETKLEDTYYHTAENSRKMKNIFE